MGALVMGVLSSLPLISAGNICCCLWVISGGVAAAYALQQGQPNPVTPADGAFVGFLAGLLGAVVYFVIALPLDLLIGPMEREMMRRWVENMGGAEGFRDYADRANLITAPVRAFVGFVLMLFLGAIFSTIGGILGALMFKKPPVPAQP
ncbi:MAG TPA: hypothetical protein VN628_16105 [Vicinamibacterales bacterium]|nr:hypothetical protein [Vicinamibacterales bacterium]